MPAAKPTPERKSRSGSYVHETQRGTVRVRIDRRVHSLASNLATLWGCEPVEAIERAVIEAAEKV